MVSWSSPPPPTIYGDGMRWAYRMSGGGGAKDKGGKE